MRLSHSSSINKFLVNNMENALFVSMALLGKNIAPPLELTTKYVYKKYENVTLIYRFISEIG